MILPRPCQPTACPLIFCTTSKAEVIEVKSDVKALSDKEDGPTLVSLAAQSAVLLSTLAVSARRTSQ